MGKVGRPSKYKPEYVQALIDFFSTEPYADLELPHYKDGKLTWTDIKRLPSKLPTLVGFAKSINVSIRTVYDWIDKKHTSYQEEFSHVFTYVAKRLQKEFLIQNGLQGLYNPAFAKFTAINMTDMSDKQEIEHKGINLIYGYRDAGRATSSLRDKPGNEGSEQPESDSV